MKIFTDGNQVVDGQSKGELIELRLSRLRLGEGAEIDLESLVGEAVGIGKGEASQTFIGTSQILVFQLRGEEAIDEDALASEIDERKKVRGRTEFIDVTVGEEKRSNPVGILREEDLGGVATAVVRDKIDGIDVETVEELGEQGGLGMRRDGLALVRFREAEAHEIRCDAAAVGVKAFESSTPLIAVERITVNEEGCWAMSGLDVGDARHGEIGKTA
jgi:hypothetical protein